jgi:hypothetical protein
MFQPVPRVDRWEPLIAGIVAALMCAVAVCAAYLS